MLSSKITSWLIIILAVALLAVGYLFNQWQHQVKETDRWKNNYTAEAANSARRQDLTVKEFEKRFTKFDSIARAIEIKTRTITDVLHIGYRLKDTTVVKTEIVRDSVHNVGHVLISKPCYTLSGTMSKDTFEYKLKYSDDIIPFLYKDNKTKISFKSKIKLQMDKSFLFVKWNNHYTAKVYSTCMQDTLKVLKYIHVEKNKKAYRK